MSGGFVVQGPPRRRACPPDRLTPARASTVAPLSWLFYALATVVLWTGWTFIGKIALKTVSPVQATIIYGLASVAVGAATLLLGSRGGAWSQPGLWLATLSAVVGSLGLLTYYLALERGKASLVGPVVSVYPAIVALLSVALLSERLSAVQVAGIVLAVTGVVLVGTG